MVLSHIWLRQAFLDLIKNFSYSMIHLCHMIFKWFVYDVIDWIVFFCWLIWNDGKLAKSDIYGLLYVFPCKQTHYRASCYDCVTWVIICQALWEACIVRPKVEANISDDTNGIGCFWPDSLLLHAEHALYIGILWTRLGYSYHTACLVMFDQSLQLWEWFWSCSSYWSVDRELWS